MKKFIVWACIVSLLAGISFGSDCHFQLATDINGDCKVDLGDVAQLALDWLLDCNNSPNDSRCTPLDIDEDGFDAIADCNDNDPTIYPGATEIPNDGVDQDCDGEDATGPAEPDGMVFLSINDPGVSGHEGFDGEMSKYETTNGQYCQFLNAALASGDIYVSSNVVYGSNGSNAGTDFSAQFYCYTYETVSNSQITYSEGVFSVLSREGYDMTNHPVVMVNWYGATAFCNYYGYRLPTEWEWQAVADYDGSFSYGYGTILDQSKANYDYANPLNLHTYPYTSPVDYYPSYGYGMNDMAGNVLEWTSSYLDLSYPVYRGGSWDRYRSNCTVSYRSFDLPHYAFYWLGFRVCR